MAEISAQRFTFRAAASTAGWTHDHMRRYWTEGAGSFPITWISSQPAPQETDDIMRRVEALRDGETQWGCDGAHRGRRGDPDCPDFLHHHHDFRCAPPTARECEMAGVPYRTQWASRA